MTDRIYQAICAAWYGSRSPEGPPQVTQTAPGVYRVDVPPGVINPTVMAADPNQAAARELSRRLGVPVGLTDARYTPDGAAVTLRIPAPPAPAPAGAAASTTGGTTMTDLTDVRDAGRMIEPEPGSVPRQRLGSAPVPPRWRALNDDVADYEAQDDADLMSWFAGEVSGLAGHADALISFYETCVDSRGLDPAAMHAVHDSADAAAETARAVAAARKKFATHYAEVREFAAGGGVLPHDARTWITGEDG
jgi:hypothetical protein